MINYKAQLGNKIISHMQILPYPNDLCSNECYAQDFGLQLQYKNNNQMKIPNEYH